MRQTKASTKTYVRKVTEYTKGKLKDCSCDNITIFLPKTTDEEVELLRENFKQVKRGAFGYIEFKD